MTSRVESYRNHARAMSEAQHKPECVWSRPREAERLSKPGPRWGFIYDAAGDVEALGWLGMTTPIERCPGCVTDDERALWRRLADEADEYLGSRT